MNAQHLVKLANNIGSFFESEKDRVKAVQGIATHIRNFWEPRMRRGIYTHLDEHGGDGLSALVLEALQTHRGALEPAPTRA